MPKAIGVSTDANTISTTFTTYKTGGEASFSFQNDGSLASLYCGVTGNASVNAATNKMFRNTNQWAFYCFYKNRYLAQLRNYGSLLQVNPLAAAIRRLPEQFDGNNKATVTAYKNFFDTYGTHLITKVRRGSRLLLVRNCRKEKYTSLMSSSKPGETIPIKQSTRSGRRTLEHITEESPVVASTTNP